MTSVSSLVLTMLVRSSVFLLFSTTKAHLPLVISARMSMSVSVNFLPGSFVIFGPFDVLGASMFSDGVGFLISIF